MEYDELRHLGDGNLAPKLYWKDKYGRHNKPNKLP